jgi:D-lyxose ketol-isomerase
MLTSQQVETYQRKAAAMFDKAGIYVTDGEKKNIEIVDLGLSAFEATGLGILVYVNTERCCAKELALWPRQTCPEHMHPPVDGDPGKEETFRCRWGRMYLYIPGAPAASPKCEPPAGPEATYTSWHEIELNPGDQYTIGPNTLHWFQAGDEGCVVSEFSTRSTDEHDIFTDKSIARATEIR